MSAARTRVKICGLTRRDDALRAVDLGADAVGFVFAPRSRRLADPEVVARIVEEIPPFVTVVGVFQDQPALEVRATAASCGLHLVQLHGAEDPAFARAVDRPVLKAAWLGQTADLAQLDAWPRATAFLLDAVAHGARGGTGRTCDWALARRAAERVRVVLAGGLHAGNVADAIRAVGPWAVDGATGTEAAPGRKDPEKLRAFLAAVRAADAERADDGSRSP